MFDFGGDGRLTNAHLQIANDSSDDESSIDIAPSAMGLGPGLTLSYPSDALLELDNVLLGRADKLTSLTVRKLADWGVDRFRQLVRFLRTAQALKEVDIQLASCPGSHGPDRIATCIEALLANKRVSLEVFRCDRYPRPNGIAYGLIQALLSTAHQIWFDEEKSSRVTLRRASGSCLSLQCQWPQISDLLHTQRDITLIHLSFSVDSLRYRDASALREKLDRLPSVKSVEVAGTGAFTDLTTIFTSVAQCTTIKSFTLRGGKLGSVIADIAISSLHSGDEPLDTSELAACLNSTLRRLTLEDISFEEAPSFLLNGFSSLTSLRLIKCDSLPAFAVGRLLRRNGTSLRKIELQERSSHSGLIDLVEFLEAGQTNLVDPSLSFPPPDEQLLRQLHFSLANAPYLQRLTLSLGQQLELFDSLGALQSISHLSLPMYSIESIELLQSLLRGVRACPSLKSLKGLLVSSGVQREFLSELANLNNVETLEFECSLVLKDRDSFETLMSSLEANGRLNEVQPVLIVGDADKRLAAELQFRLDLNRFEHNLVESQNTPAGLVPLVFAQASTKPSLSYYWLRKMPTLFDR